MRKTMFIFFIGLALTIGFYGNVHALSGYDPYSCTVAEEQSCASCHANDGKCRLPETEVICNDGTDNDNDGLIDCADQDCNVDIDCQSPTYETDCADTIDNDNDNFIDCADSDCIGDAACLPVNETNCIDQLDNNVNGLIDCDDPDCSDDQACTSTCGAKGEACATGDDCCSGLCHPVKLECK